MLAGGLVAARAQRCVRLVVLPPEGPLLRDGDDRRRRDRADRVHQLGLRRRRGRPVDPDGPTRAGARWCSPTRRRTTGSRSALLALTLLATFAVERSFLGYYFRAIKDEPDAARSIGIDIARYKQVALSRQRVLHRDRRQPVRAEGALHRSGVGAVDGAVDQDGAGRRSSAASARCSGRCVGAVVLTVIEEAVALDLRRHRPRHRHGDLRRLIVVVAVFYPSGIVGWFKERAARRRRARRRQRGAGRAARRRRGAGARHESTGASL